MSILLTAVVTLGVIGAASAAILYLIGQKFKVVEDPRIEQVQEALPAANCGGCGYPGCGGFAAALVKSDTMDGFYCPVGGQATMDKVAEILGRTAAVSAKKIAVVRCNGTCEHRPRVNYYDGASNCAIASSLYGGDTGCSFGCLGLGDCVESCTFDAIHINPETMLPEVVEDKCTACGACVKACPKDLIELRKQGPKSRRIYVSCMNKDKGGVARKSCDVACIGCSKCFQVCPFEAITMENNLAYIDDDKCRLCRKCVPVCPTNSIWELNFPPRKEVKEEAVKAEV
ncbi:MAG: Fe-S cluster domain-containing protein [Petrimonas sp.]|nr:Fe-S cluster domain-containing protein [Petrimonas sp.]